MAPPASALGRLLLLVAGASASLVPQTTAHEDNPDTPLPLVIWHGLGDTFASEGIQAISSLAEAVNPGTFVHTVTLSARDPSGDRTATFYGNLTEQVDAVCGQLASHPILSTAPAVDALGFSQGGQFLRAYVERCNRPPVRSLVTFGSQHNGISEFRACGRSEWLCKGAMALLRFNTWSAFVQSRLVPAQYFRDPADPASYAAYLESSNFLADVNNERRRKDPAYARNLASLDNFVMYLFAEDTTVVPPRSAWFDEVNGTVVTPLRERDLYREDWLGLKQLDKRGGLRFRTVEGADHMQIDEQTLNKTFADFFGVHGRKFKPEGWVEAPKVDEGLEL